MSTQKQAARMLSLLILLFTLPFVSACEKTKVSDWHLRSASSSKEEDSMNSNLFFLPEVKTDSQFSLEKSIAMRRSVREFRDEAISLQDLSQLLWAANGITEPAKGYRSAPSAGALYPLEIYLSAGNIEDLSPGLYHYDPHKHALTLKQSGDPRPDLQAACLNQDALASAPLALIFCALPERTEVKYGSRSERYIHLEIGHAAQNASLQAVALNMASVPVGAFKDDLLASLPGIDPAHRPFYVLPLGFPR